MKDFAMQIIVNGTPRDISENLSLLDLLTELKLNAETTIVELNREIVLKTSYGDVTLSDGDALELVRIVGGG